MTPARLGALLALLLPWTLGVAPAAGQPSDGRGAIVFRVRDLSFEELLAIPAVGALARAGGAGVLAGAGDVVTVSGSGAGPERTLELDPARLGGIEGVDQAVREAVLTSRADRLLVIAMGGTSPRARGQKDDLRGIVLASGPPGELFPDVGPAGSLTSDSTRRTGVVAGGDVRATLDAFLGGAPLVSGELPPGEVIRVVQGPAPFELHERYLSQRRMYVPVGAAAALYVTAVGLLGIAFLAARRRVPASWRRAAGWAALSVPMLATGMLAVGHLPDLSYATAIPMIAIVTVFGTMAFSPLERSDLALVPAGIGVAVLALAALEALLGWTGMLTPLLGGSQLDGGRFYGLPNVAIGLLVGCALWVAQRLRTFQGFWLLCALGLFAGLPFLGANLGAAVTSFAAAGLWVAVRERDRLGLWRGLGVILGVTAAGAVVILVAHAISPIETHIARFEEHTGGLEGVLGTFADRLRVGIDLIARSPAAIVPVLGLPVVLVAILRPPTALRSTFERWPASRDAALVTILAGMVAYLVNDSGPAAAGLAFGLGLGGVLGMSLLAPQGKMVEP